MSAPKGESRKPSRKSQLKRGCRKRVTRSVKQRRKARVTLVAASIPNFCVEIRPPQDGEYLVGVIDEMMTHIGACLGRAPAWFHRSAGDNPPVRIILERRASLPFDREEFEVHAVPDAVTLRAATREGLFHAVYYFLEQAFGCRWLWPGASGVVTPRVRAVSWPVGSQRHKPDWAWRRLWLSGAFWREDDPALAEMKQAGIRGSTLDALCQWQRRNRLGGLNIADGHRWAEICSPLEYGEEHPEYFALVKGVRDTAYHDGKHGNQPCTSNPEVVSLTARHVVAQFRSRPELDGYSIAVNDGGGFCECPACLGLDRRPAGQDAQGAKGLNRITIEDGSPDEEARMLTDRMLRFANEVADRVGRECPDKMLLFLIYSAYRNAPGTVTLRENVIAQFCTFSCYHAHPDVHNAEMRLLRRVSKSVKKLGIYDYLVNGANGSVPRGCARVLHRCLAEYHAAGCRYYASQSGFDFALGGLAYYVAARSLWNGAIPFEDILADYCRSGFGPASGQVKRFLTAFMDRWERIPEADSRRTAEELALCLYDPRWRQARRTQLQRARALCAADPAARSRVAHLEQGMLFLDLFCEASSSAIGLLDAGAPTRKALPDDLRRWVLTAGRRTEIRKAVRARRRLLDWVRANSDGFYISAMWFEYQRRQRGGLLGSWLDILESALVSGKLPLGIRSGSERGWRLNHCNREKR